MNETNEMPPINPNQTDRVIANAMDTEKEPVDNLIRLSTGVVLRAKQANPNLLIRVMNKVRRPQPPLYFDKVMGREMENPNDPDYISRVEAWTMDYSGGMYNVLIGAGTELVSIPPGMEGPDGEKWIKDYQAFDLPSISDSPAWRYITWVMVKAAVIDKDMEAIGKKVKALSGVKEEDVQNATNFPPSN